MIALLLATVFSTHALRCSNGVNVTLRVYSSSADPVHELSASDCQKVVAVANETDVTCARVGYSGFVVHAATTLFIAPGSSRVLETYLLARFQVPQSVKRHVSAALSLSDPCLPLWRSTQSHSRISDTCKAPIRGPDSPPVYDPQTDDSGCFITEQSKNNCYNYGNDVVTNTYAQPGVGTGDKWKNNTCDSVGKAAQRDGLIFAGQTLPTVQPAIGHFVALLIWPNRNFHWIRMDSNLTWSHKPGPTAVRNVDNNNRTITDPRKSNFTPWTEFCAFYRTVPSSVSIG
jgi:hypothetical protein